MLSSHRGAALLLIVGGVSDQQRVLEKRATVEAAANRAPSFEVDPLWPKPMPNGSSLGQTIGVAVDAQDHVWIIHRQDTLEANEGHATTNPPIAKCCAPAPPVLAFDQQGNVVAHWGGKGQGYDWPVSNHGITIDYQGNVWIGGNGRGQAPGAARGQGGGRGPAAKAENQGGPQGYFKDTMGVD